MTAPEGTDLNVKDQLQKDKRSRQIMNRDFIFIPLNLINQRRWNREEKLAQYGNYSYDKI